jgi:peptide chain release factor 2
MENLIKNIEMLREKVAAAAVMLRVEESRSRMAGLKNEMNSQSFWNDQENAVKVSREAENLEKEVGRWDEMAREVRELEEITALVGKEGDEGGQGDAKFEDELGEKYKELEKKFNELEFFVLFSGRYDRTNAILSVHAGTGGVDAQDWAEILDRMFLRFAEKKSFRAEILDRTYGNEAGIKSSSIRISGEWAYGYLKSENGVHRLVRISPFDAESMRHTSFALVEVIPEMPEAEEIEIKDEDIRIDVFRSSGPGGQSVNTTDSAVRIVHKATGITVACQNERSQHQNKENALKILKAKLFTLEEERKRAVEMKLKGGVKKAEWGKQIRSYVMQPYQMVKDHRTNYETADINSVLDGDLEKFMEAYLRSLV